MIRFNLMYFIMYTLMVICLVFIVGFALNQESMPLLGSAFFSVFLMLLFWFLMIIVAIFKRDILQTNFTLMSDRTYYNLWFFSLSSILLAVVFAVLENISSIDSSRTFEILKWMGIILLGLFLLSFTSPLPPSLPELSEQKGVEELFLEEYQCQVKAEEKSESKEETEEKKSLEKERLEYLLLKAKNKLKSLENETNSFSYSVSADYKIYLQKKIEKQNKEIEELEKSINI